MTIYPVYCPECGWFGMSDDCKYMRCPHCTARVKNDALRVNSDTTEE